MIAFVGSSMANTSEVKKLLIEKSCEEKAIDYMDAMDPNNQMSPLEAYYAYRAFVDGCNSAKKKNVLALSNG